MAFGALKSNLVMAYGWNLALAAAVAATLAAMAVGTAFPSLFLDDQFVFLARNFAAGRLSVDDLHPQLRDVVLWNGHKYLPFGPLPGVLLIPFLPLIDRGLHPVWVAHLLTLTNVLMFWRILGRAGVSAEARRWGVLLLFGGTVYLSVAALGGGAAHTSHVLTMSLMMGALLLHLQGRSSLAVGLLLGLAASTRFTALLALPFFLLYPRPRQVFGLALRLVIGLAPVLMLLATYNWLRFGSPLESGYALAELGDSFIEDARSQGLFSLQHLPKNLYAFLLLPPQPWPDLDAGVFRFPYLWVSPWGLGILFASPALFYALYARSARRLVVACWVGFACVAALVLTYYGVGRVQAGFRYGLDFMPFLAILAALGMGKMSNTARALVLWGVVVNVWATSFLIVGMRAPLGG